MKRSVSRRRFLQTMAAGGLGAASYMHWCEPGWLRVGRHTVPIDPALPQVRILHISDLHASPVVSLRQIGEATDLGLSLKPDLVCLTGDYITRKYDYFAELGQLLKGFGRAAPTFACLGNHDGGRWSARRGYADTSKVETMLSDAGVTLLRNRSATITLNQRPLTLVGVGDMWAEDLDATKAFKGVAETPRETVVLLSHNPDSKSRVQHFPWDLMLSGHTHGGQLWIPMIGAPFAPVRDKRFVKGLRRWNDRWIHVTKGVGNLHGLRLNCPPEVSLLTLA
ncbi:MAG TPA: phosphodiesterase YaeI [Verrucomicrobiae bacterium]|nr:phosphodiesterase YaeI [Verrucomicrobiae bacterium]